MQEKTCRECEHYLQHYALGKRKLFSLYCGHCVFPKVRRRMPGAKVCEHFVSGEKDEALFVSKEYLSRELLKYVLSLELLPEIEDGE